MSRELGRIDRNDFPLPAFESAEQTVTFNNLLDVAHGLGAVPKMWQIVLLCKTTELGYAVGDEVMSFAPTGAINRNVTFSVDATNITVVNSDALFLIVQSSFNTSNITVGNWRWIMRAWR